MSFYKIKKIIINDMISNLVIIREKINLYRKGKLKIEPFSPSDFWINEFGKEPYKIISDKILKSLKKFLFKSVNRQDLIKYTGWRKELFMNIESEFVKYAKIFFRDNGLVRFCSFFSNIQGKYNTLVDDKASYRIEAYLLIEKGKLKLVHNPKTYKIIFDKWRVRRSKKLLIEVR